MNLVTRRIIATMNNGVPAIPTSESEGEPMTDKEELAPETDAVIDPESLIALVEEDEDFPETGAGADDCPSGDDWDHLPGS